MQRKFKNHEPVKIHSLGPTHGDNVYYGNIVGISVDWTGIDGATIWIVKLPHREQVALNTEYECITMPEACLESL